MNYKLSYGIKVRLDNGDCMAKDEFAPAIWKLVSAESKSIQGFVRNQRTSDSTANISEG